MTRASRERVVRWYFKHSKQTYLICDGNAHAMDIQSIRIKILWTGFIYQLYFQSFLLFLFSQDSPEMFSVCSGQNYFLLDWLGSMAVGRKTFFIEKMKDIFRKYSSTIILQHWLCILLVSQEQIQILNTTFTAVEFSLQKSRTSLIYMWI